ncbi:hypothetical protein [Oceanicola sp. S124]|uniref:hypothetical protein n=1 Tax=Oceanicola sp. S124 TaxID=1042378 RepID=UPI0002D9913B|nr:hypothetical protein [Oceanicola sp. S124]
MIWLLRAVRWVRNPPSEGRVLLVAAVVAICLAIWGLEQLFGFPDWLTPERLPRR